jgi:hypothetical protein
MDNSKTYENYPTRIVILSNMVSLIIYSMGFIIMNRLGILVAIIYLLFILTLEYKLISRHCINCYYWGKTCGFGKGRISALFFKKGDISKFCSNKMSWKDMIPDLLVSLAPVAVGIVLMIIKFDLVILLASVLIIILSTSGNGFIRGTLTCSYCKQKESDCPAHTLFNKNKQQ